MDRIDFDGDCIARKEGGRELDSQGLCEGNARPSKVATLLEIQTATPWPTNPEGPLKLISGRDATRVPKIPIL